MISSFDMNYLVIPYYQQPGEASTMQDRIANGVLYFMNGQEPEENRFNHQEIKSIVETIKGISDRLRQGKSREYGFYAIKGGMKRLVTTDSTGYYIHPINGFSKYRSEPRIHVDIDGNVSLIVKRQYPIPGTLQIKN